MAPHAPVLASVEAPAPPQTELRSFRLRVLDPYRSLALICSHSSPLLHVRSHSPAQEILGLLQAPSARKHDWRQKAKSLMIIIHGHLGVLWRSPYTSIRLPASSWK